MEKEIEKYFIERAKEEQPVFRQLLRDLKNEIKDDLLDELRSLSFIMLKPDAYLRGLVPSVLGLLQDNNIYTTHYKLKQLEASEIDTLYMFVKPKYIESWWIMDKTYRLAPCCPAIVVGKWEPWDHLSLRIRNLVGPTTPTLGDESNIRYKFRGAHRIFNMIHGTDDPAAAVREALVFFSLDDIRAALGIAKSLDQAMPDVTISKASLMPQQVVDLDLQKATHNLKLKLLRRWVADRHSLSLTLEDRGIALGFLERLQEIETRLQKLLDWEKEVIDVRGAAKERKAKLLPVLYYQLRAASLARDFIRQIRGSISRDSSLESEVRKAAMSFIPPIEKCIEVSRSLTTSVEFKECNFDDYLCWVRFLDIELDAFDEANLHAAWSVVATEFVDFEIKLPEEP